MPEATQLTARQAVLASLRQPHESVWRDCFDYTFPLRASGLQSSDLTAQSGQAKKALLADGTGTDAARILASGIMSGVTPPNSLWFNLSVENATSEEKRWLEDAANTTFAAIHGANFDSAGFEGALDLVAAGWFVLYVDSNPATRSLTFEQWPLSECFIASSTTDGLIDTISRPFQMSAEACLKEYGNECSPEVTKLAKEKPDTQIDLLRQIYPRSKDDGYIPGSTLAKHMPYASCTVESKSKKLLRERGYNEKPMIVPRWQKLPKSVYAVGPAFDALADMRTLNQLAIDELANADLTLAGMWIAEDDGVLNPRTIKVGPRKVIVANSVESMKALQPSGNWQYSVELASRYQANIRKIFMADQLQPQEGPQMTATEVRVRVALIRQLLGPVYGRLQSEYLAPMIERCFGLLLRMNAFPPPPDTLKGRAYEVRYTSPLARAQRAEDVTAMDQFESALLEAAQFRPEVMDVYDWDEGERERGDLLGVPAKLIRSPQELKKIRDARVAAQKQQAADEAMQTGTQAFAEAKGQQLATH